MYLKLSYFLYHNLILFSEKNYKKQTQIFYQNYSTMLYTVDIFCNSILRKIIQLPDWAYWVRINFMIEWT